MKIALASARTVDRSIAYNLSQMERYMREAKAGGAELVCFGEAFLQGFNSLSWTYAQDREIAVTTSSKELEQIRRWTRQFAIDVLFGYNEREDDSIYSSCALIADGRILHNYRRISKGWKVYWKTDEHYKEGLSVDVFDYKGVKCAIGLCGDLWEAPERFALGEAILFWPVYVSWTREEWENGRKLEYAAQAKLCCENTLYINSICEGDAFGGAAQFVNGRLRRELPIFKEGLLYAEV